MSNPEHTIGYKKPPITITDLKLRRAWKKGLPLEKALIEVYNYPSNLFPTIGHLKQYLRSSVDYPEYFYECAGVSATPEQLEIVAGCLTSDIMADGLGNLELHIEAMTLLKGYLFEDLYQQKYESIGTRPFDITAISHVDRYWYIEPDEDERPFLQNIQLGPTEYTVSYESLYHWFKEYGIDVKKWKNFKSFKKSGIPKHEVPNPSSTKHKTIESGHYFKTYLQLLKALMQLDPDLPNNKGGVVKSRLIEKYFSDFIDAPNEFDLPKESTIRNAIDYLEDNFD